MTPAYLLHQLIEQAALREPSREALRAGLEAMDYATLTGQVQAFAHGLLQIGLERGDRVAVYLDKRPENVVGCFGTSYAGGVLVPINPLLKAKQVAHILRDCGVRVLLTTGARLALLEDELAHTPDLHAAVLTDGGGESIAHLTTHRFHGLLQAPPALPHRVIDTDLAAVFYTSGSTGQPRGVMLSHRNLIAGAVSVAHYLENHREDSLLAALPLSFDAGFSQLTTAFAVGARVVLLNYLMPRDVLSVMEQQPITGITAVPPMWAQLAQQDWPAHATEHLRYFATTGARMPREVLDALRHKLPRARPYLMYGLTEAFRSTYLPPTEVDRRPDSIGRAIPNAEILVLREDGSAADVGEPGELVHRGAQVALGYWNDPVKTAERFRALPRKPGQVIDELAVFSGDTVRADAEGFLYFIGRRDEMIKTSGYRVSPTEVESTLYAQEGVAEAAVFAVAHPTLGQAIVGVVTPRGAATLDEKALIHACRAALPAYMVPQRIMVFSEGLPRNPNGKIDRVTLGQEYRHLFSAHVA